MLFHDLIILRGNVSKIIFDVILFQTVKPVLSGPNLSLLRLIQSPKRPTDNPATVTMTWIMRFRSVCHQHKDGDTHFV